MTTNDGTPSKQLLETEDNLTAISKASVALAAYLLVRRIERGVLASAEAKDVIERTTNYTITWSQIGDEQCDPVLAADIAKLFSNVLEPPALKD